MDATQRRSGIKHRLLRAANWALRPTRLELIPKRRLALLSSFHAAFAVPEPQPPALDGQLAEYLREQRGELEALRARYAAVGLPTSQWEDSVVGDALDLGSFRSDNMYVFQGRGTASFQFVESARYVREMDRLGLADRLVEDGAFGAQVVAVDGWEVSRDLLDSILEINFLDEVLGSASLAGQAVLDIGAGYGRLAHRMCAALPDIGRYICTDGVAQSTFLQQFYLGYRRVERGEVLALDRVDDIAGDDGIRLAINIHSFPEMPMATSGWWFDHIARCGVPHVFLVTDYHAGTTSIEPDGRRSGDFTEHLRRNGYRLLVDRPKYDAAKIRPEFQLYPAHYWVFERTG